MRKMKKAGVLFAAAVMAVSLAACGSSQGTGDSASSASGSSISGSASSASVTMVGGWETPASPEMTEEASNALDKALSGLTGASYKPVALLGTQVVAGTNYEILCRETMAVQNPEETWAIVTVYEDLDGNAEITDVQDSGVSTDIYDTESLAGGWEAEDSPVITDEEKQIFEKGFANTESEKYTPCAILSHQIVSGENYCFLAKKGDGESYAFVWLYEDLDGNVSVTKVTDFTADNSGTASTAGSSEASY